MHADALIANPVPVILVTGSRSHKKQLRFTSATVVPLICK